jgi:hypothetical protein
MVMTDKPRNKPLPPNWEDCSTPIEWARDALVSGRFREVLWLVNAMPPEKQEQYWAACEAWAEASLKFGQTQIVTDFVRAIPERRRPPFREIWKRVIKAGTVDPPRPPPREKDDDR